MKILHIITGLNTGGAEMMLYKLLSRTNRNEFEPVVISLMDEGTLGYHILKLNIPVYCLNLKWSKLPLLTLLKLIKKIKPDLIQGWMYHGNLIAILAKGFSNRYIPVLWNIRQSLYSLSYEKRSTALVIRLGQYFSSFSDKIIYNSVTSKKHHEKIGYNSNKNVVIPNGFDIQKFKPSLTKRNSIRQELSIAENSYIIGLIARFHSMKDHNNFLQAASILLKKYSDLDVCFLMCGSGVSQDNIVLVNRIKELGLTNQVYLLGERQDIDCLTAALDIAVCSSFTESFPNVVGEAMACGVPCTVTDVGDSAWIVGDTGKVVPPRDSKALAQAWEDLMNMGVEGRQKLGQAARRRIVEHFSLEVVVEQYEGLYYSLAKGL